MPSEVKLAKIITIFNQKGGVGKTTTTCQLAGTFGHRGYDVLVADLDEQQSSKAWLQNQDGQNFPGQLWVGSGYKAKITEELRKLSTKYDLIFVDCAPAVDQPGTWESLLVSDLAIVPTKLNPTDTQALPKALELAKKVHTTSGLNYPVRILPTAVRNGRKDDRETLEFLTVSNPFPEFRVLPQVLSDRVVFQRSMLAGATAHQLPNSKEAVEELDALADAVAELLGIAPTKENE